MAIQSNSSKREWVILCHNIRGINSEGKWSSIRNKIAESRCDILCLQETKRDFFYLDYIRKFSPRAFDSYSYISSIGNSGGTLVVWKGDKFLGTKTFQNSYS
jgi:exonuclease III